MDKKWHFSYRTSLSLPFKSYGEVTSPNGKWRLFSISCNKQCIYQLLKWLFKTRSPCLKTIPSNLKPSEEYKNPRDVSAQWLRKWPMLFSYIFKKNTQWIHPLTSFILSSDHSLISNGSYILSLKPVHYSKKTSASRVNVTVKGCEKTAVINAA